MKKIKNTKPFDKYHYYTKAVQSPETDVEYLDQVYTQLTGSKAKTLREDFCGTFAISTEWVKTKKDHVAYSIDLDPEPLRYGEAVYFNKLKKDQQDRLYPICGDVMEVKLPLVDVACALNFSYFLFKTREKLVKYFSKVYKSLNSKGILVIDVFGGSHCYDENQEKTEHRGFNYYWHQKGFDPVTNGAQFAIHFKRNGEPKRKDVFQYDWRLWSIPELRELLVEAGFQKTHVYWEGTKKDGTGNGHFTMTEQGEPCLSWIAYIAAEK